MSREAVKIAPSMIPVNQVPPLSPRMIAVLLLLGISVFINYMDRGNLSIAAHLIQDELSMSPTRLGLLLSAFFWTYACLQPIAGWLVDRLDVNRVIAGGFFLWSVATAGIGAAHSFAMLFALRLMVGIGESVAYPSYSKIIAANYPEEQRGLASSFITAGLLLGPGVGITAGGMIVSRVGWRPFFVMLGMISLGWLIPWLKWMPRRPDAIPQTAMGVPTLREFLSIRSAWGTCIGLFCSNYVNYFLITWMPFYLVRERHFSMAAMAKIGGGAYLLAACAAALSGWWSDQWIRHGQTPTRVRKTFAAGGLGLAGVFLGVSGAVGPGLSVPLLISGIVFFAVGSSNIWPITQTLAGAEAAGRWTGFQNFIGNLAGISAPALTGIVLARTGKFYFALLILNAVALVGAMSWAFLVGRVEQVAWRTDQPQQWVAAKS